MVKIIIKIYLNKIRTVNQYKIQIIYPQFNLKDHKQNYFLKLQIIIIAKIKRKMEFFNTQKIMKIIYPSKKKTLYKLYIKKFFFYIILY